MTKVLAALVASVILIVALASAAVAQRGEPVLPAEVQTEMWDGGVYVQPVATRADGQIGCRFIVAVDKASVGATLEGTVNGDPVSAVVQAYVFGGVVHHGRATFEVAGPGPFAFVTSNTTPIVGANC